MIKGYKLRKTRFLLAVDKKKELKLSLSVCCTLSGPVLWAGARGSTGQCGVEEFKQTERKVWEGIKWQRERERELVNVFFSRLLMLAADGHLLQPRGPVGVTPQVRCWDATDAARWRGRCDNEKHNGRFKKAAICGQTEDSRWKFWCRKWIRTFNLWIVDRFKRFNQQKRMKNSHGNTLRVITGWAI